MPKYKHFYCYKGETHWWSRSDEFSTTLNLAREGIRQNCESTGSEALDQVTLAVLNIKCSTAAPGERITFPYVGDPWSHWFEELPDDAT